MTRQTDEPPKRATGVWHKRQETMMTNSHPIAAPTSGLVSTQPAGVEVCSGGLAWACIFTPQLGAAPIANVSAQLTAVEVCSGGLAWACVFTPQLVDQN